MRRLSARRTRVTENNQKKRSTMRIQMILATRGRSSRRRSGLVRDIDDAQPAQFRRCTAGAPRQGRSGIVCNSPTKTVIALRH
jgi:hypothetical protein